jgi:tRNA threonylcarbamoyladenosine biosynthesis protein TsaB
LTSRPRRILAIDTATWNCGVALVRDGVVLAERAERTPSNHAGTLPRVVALTLAAAGERLERDDAIAVTIGPGSFTGLRIALGFAKGIVYAGGYRLLGVPTLDALALAAPPGSGRLCAVFDARKREVYAAVYERDGARLVRLGEPRAVAAEALAVAIAGPCTFIGDGVEAYGDVFRGVLGADAVLLASATHPPRPATVARLAAARLATDDAGDDVEALAPTYLRPPEAEVSQSVHSPSRAPMTLEFVDKVPIVY